MKNLKKFESAIIKGCQGTRKIKKALFRFRKDGSVSGACVLGALHLGLGNKEVVEAPVAGRNSAQGGERRIKGILE